MKEETLTFPSVTSFLDDQTRRVVSNDVTRAADDSEVTTQTDETPGEGNNTSQAGACEQLADRKRNVTGPSTADDTSALERRHVRDVYERTADCFANARFKAWPSVRKFLLKLPPGSLVADVGE